MVHVAKEGGDASDVLKQIQCHQQLDIDKKNKNFNNL